MVRQVSCFAPHSWVDPRLEVRPSEIAGLGLFATVAIPEGERLILWGGNLYSRQEAFSEKVRFDSIGEVGDDLYLGQPVGSPSLPDERMNHSCDPNLWLVGTGQFETRRSVQEGGEVLADYATWETAPGWSMPCSCGAPSCRGVITGDQWCLPTLRVRHGNHFSPHILARFRRANK